MKRIALLACLFFMATSSHGAFVIVTWDANTELNLQDYTLFWGTQSRIYSNQATVTLPFSIAAPLDEGETYYFAAIARNTDGIESGLSEEISFTVPLPPPSPTPTAIPTPSPVVTPSPTPVVTPTITPSPTPPRTPTPSPTKSPHRTPTPARSPTPTATPSPAPTPSPPNPPQNLRTGG